MQHIACRNLMRKNRALTAARATALESGGETAAMEDAEDVAASKVNLKGAPLFASLSISN